MNFLLTIVGMALVDRKGRRFLLILGTSGIIASLVGVGILFLRTENVSLDARAPVQAMITPNQELTLRFDRDEAARLLAAQGVADKRIDARPRIAGHHLLLRRFHRRHHLCALRRPRRPAH